jgi:hypothetical protein
MTSKKVQNPTCTPGIRDLETDRSTLQARMPDAKETPSTTRYTMKAFPSIHAAKGFLISKGWRYSHKYGRHHIFTRPVCHARKATPVCRYDVKSKTIVA